MRRVTLILLLLGGCPSSSNPAVVDGGTGSDGSTAIDAASPCSSEGQTRISPCGNCGEWSEICSGGYWVAQSACLNQGECPAGTVETGTLPLCGEQQRLCSMECGWGEWATTVPSTGECEPGTTGRATNGCPAFSYRPQTCSDSCEWVVDATECTDGCTNDGATTPPEEAEICIAAGPFIRGAEGDLLGYTSTPVREVYLDAFYMERYPVTLRRYKECYEAGACQPPYSPDGRWWDSTTGSDDYVYVQARWDDALAFCTWIGKRLPTEAELEKAARGPSSRENLYPWEGSYCSAPYSQECGWDALGYVSDLYDGMPLTASYYGVEQLLGVLQPASDWVDNSYYADDSSLVNPQGPPSGEYRVSRGAGRIDMDNTCWLTTRGASSALASIHAIRCARAPSP